MPAHLYEFAGITLHVEYAFNTDDGIPTIHSVRVLNADYQPCGPDLIDWLQRLVFMHTTEAGEAMLSIIVGEIYSAHDRH